MADHDYRGDLDDFVADLRRAWRAVGGPSYAQLECLSARVLRQRRPDGVQFVSLAPSTTSEILSGRRKQALKWPWVLTFLTVLQVAAQRGGIDAGVVGTLDEWKRKHEAVLAAAQPPARPARAGLPRQRDAHKRLDATGLAPALWTARWDAENEADALLGAYLAMVRRVRAPRGQVDCRDLDAEWLELFLNLESGSEAIRTYETEVVPGLLQTEAYAQAILAQRLPGATAGELTRLVELRMQSQRLHRWCRLWAVVEEEAFRSQRIDARTMRGQVEYLIDLAGNPNIALQVVPASTGSNLTLSEPMTIFRFPERYLGDVVCMEQPDSACFLHKRKDTEYCNQIFDTLAIMASPPAITRRRLLEIRDEIPEGHATPAHR